jgi:hypothetical protein
MNWLPLCRCSTLISTSCVPEQSCAKANGKTPASRNIETRCTCEVRLSAPVGQEPDVEVGLTEDPRNAALL